MSLNELIEISKYIGLNYSYVQAGSGNTSVKIDDEVMLVKSSGSLLAEMNENRGWTKVNYKKIKEELLSLTEKGQELEEKANQIIKESQLESHGRPSIETFLHVLLNKYVLHYHPIKINALLCSNHSEELIDSVFHKDKEEYVFVDYFKPGITLALEMTKKIQKSGKIPQVVFLKNHGVIVSADSLEELISVNERINKRAGVMDEYSLPYQIYKKVNHFYNENIVVMMSEDKVISKYLERDFFYQEALNPDYVVYCSFKPVRTSLKTIEQDFNKHFEQYGDYPKVINIDHHIFIISYNMSKAKQAEEILKSQLMIFEEGSSKGFKTLNFDQMKVLNDWEAEKYRQKV
ncbi:MAG: class II aldolase/adducin family protein [Candidatus Sericytochromatia bacterium]